MPITWGTASCKPTFPSPHLHVQCWQWTGNNRRYRGMSKKSLAEVYKTNSIKDEVLFKPLKCGNPCISLNILITQCHKWLILALETPYSNKFHKYIFYAKQKQPFLRALNFSLYKYKVPCATRQGEEAAETPLLFHVNPLPLYIASCCWLQKWTVLVNRYRKC